MSDPFTIDASNWQAAEKINELVLSWIERGASLRVDVASLINRGHNIQNSSFWRQMQEWMESWCIYFVNENMPIAGAAATTMHTVDSWRTAAGLPDGFRKRTADGWSHGVMQRGDMIGPWIFEDLIKGFGALAWTRRAVYGYGMQRRYAGGTDPSSLETAYTAQASNWADPGNEWAGASSNLYLYAAHYDHRRATFFPGGKMWLVEGNRYRVPSLSVFVPTHRPASVDVYCLPKSVGSTFEDIDAFGASENELFLLCSFPESDDPTRSSDVFSGYETNPVSEQGDQDVVYGMKFARADAVAIVKWSYSFAT